MQNENQHVEKDRVPMQQGFESDDSETKDEREIQKILQHECGRACKCGKHCCEYASDFLQGNYNFYGDEAIADEIEQSYYAAREFESDELPCHNLSNYTMIPDPNDDDKDIVSSSNS